MRALITGRNGFVGPYLAQELEAHGFEVFGLGREEGSKEGNKERYFQADILDADRITDIVTEVQPAHIVHLAGFSSPTLAEKEPDAAKAVNVDGTVHILEAAVTLARPPRVLIVSSAHVYGTAEQLPITESHSLYGQGVYAQSRIAQEKIVTTWFDRLSIIITRSFNHTGPGQLDKVFVPKVARQMVELKQGKRDALLLGNVDIKRDISDVRDIVRAYRMLLTGTEKNVIVNVCRGESILLRDFVSRMADAAGVGAVDIKTDPNVVRSEDPTDIYGSHEKLTELTGWEPEISYEEMIRGVYEYWNNQMNEIVVSPIVVGE